MSVLYLDCFSGVSGDMLLGALLDLGIERDRFNREISKLKLSGFSIEINKVNKYSITGVDVSVIADGGNNGQECGGHAGYGHDHERGHEHEHEQWHGHENGHGQDHEHEHLHGHLHGHLHEHEHEHLHEHEHEHAHEYEHEHAHEHEIRRGYEHEHEHSHENFADRSLKDILKIIDGSELDGFVKDLSSRVFLEIAAAEGKVHNVPADEVHFHEIGAIDSIVDITGVCICVWLLGVNDIKASEIHEGKGFVDTRHGRLPVPAPAVLEMLADSGIPVITENVGVELATPTGVGLLKTFVKSFGPMPPMRIARVGYGFGKHDTGRLNALRAIIGEPAEDSSRNPGGAVTFEEAERIHMDGAAGSDNIISIDANIDDMTPEALGYAMERLFAAGALDVFFTPIYMKKNRPATKLTVLARPKDRIILIDVIFKETSTLGVRESHHARSLMNRRTEILDIKPYGAIRYKIAERKGITRASPEYEDCRAYAARSGLSLSEVYGMAKEEYSRLSNSKKNQENANKHEQ